MHPKRTHLPVSGVILAVHADRETRLPSRTANLLHLIVLNLLETATQATPAGKSVSLRVCRDAHELVVAVEDEGPGFPPELLPKLFLPCKSTREGGSGLGLAISKQLADHPGASLKMEVRSGGGCRFSIALPLSQQEDLHLRPQPARVAEPIRHEPSRELSATACRTILGP